MSVSDPDADVHARMPRFIHLAAGLSCSQSMPQLSKQRLKGFHSWIQRREQQQQDAAQSSTTFEHEYMTMKMPKALMVAKPTSAEDATLMASAAWQKAISLFPSDKLVVDEESEVSTADYGGNAIKHNYDKRCAPGRVGSWRGGAYQNVKPWSHGNVTEHSVECIPWMRAVIESLVLDAECIRKARFEALAGASTRAHTDGFRGFLPNWVRFIDPGGRLLMRVDIHFRRSVVAIGRSHYVPLRYEASGFMVLVGFTPGDSPDAELTAYRFKCSQTVLQYICTVGLLPEMAVLGTDKGQLKVMRVDSSITSSARGDTATYSELMEAALANPPMHGPCIVPIGCTTRWESFEGSRFIHWFHGNHLARRVHVSSHQLEQQVGSSNVRKADVTWYFKACVGMWCQENTRKRKHSMLTWSQGRRRRRTPGA